MARKIDKIEPNDLYLDGHIQEQMQISGGETLEVED